MSDRAYISIVREVSQRTLIHLVVTMTKLYRAHKFHAEVAPSGSFANPYLHAARIPVTMPLPLHHACDHWFRARFQTSFRSRALFGTGRLAQAEKHLSEGSVLLKIWPIGPCMICYSPYVYDLFDYFSTKFAGQRLSPEVVTAELDGLGYRFSENAGLEEAASSNCEVMLVADAFGFEIQEGIS